MNIYKYKKLLVTHDGSECASAVLPHAVSMAIALNAEVLLLHVIGPFTPSVRITSTYGIGVFTSPEIDEAAARELAKRARKTATKKLEEIKDELISAGIKKVHIKVEEGYAPELILYIAKEKNVDIIMMSTHGRTGLKKVLIGSVTEHVIHRATCPILVVHPIKGTSKNKGK